MENKTGRDDVNSLLDLSDTLLRNIDFKSLQIKWQLIPLLHTCSPVAVADWPVESRLKVMRSSLSMTPCVMGEEETAAGFC